MTTRLHEAPLKHIAIATQGTYLCIASGEEWRTVFTQRVVGDTVLTQDETKLFQPLLLLGFLAFAFHVLLTRL